MIVVVHNMERAIPRTLHALSRGYQRNTPLEPFEVLVVDNGSDPPLSHEVVEGFGSEFRLIQVPHPTVSPAPAVNLGFRESRADLVGVIVDGARICSPGLFAGMHRAARLKGSTFVTLLAWHLGAMLQSEAILNGYDADEEDRLLNSIGWPADGYRLFDISGLEGSNPAGWFGPIAESTCFATRRSILDELGGFDEQFVLPGGGLVNHDFFRRVIDRPDVEPVVLLGEGTFHQVHGGVSTNSTVSPWPEFADEYTQITGRPYAVPDRQPLYFGHVSPEATRWIGAASEVDRLFRDNEWVHAHAQALADVLAAPPLIGAEACSAPVGFYSDRVVAPDASLECRLIRSCQTMTIEGWVPHNAGGQAALLIELLGISHRYQLPRGFFTVTTPLRAGAGDVIELRISCGFRFPAERTSEGDGREISWRVLGMRFDATDSAVTSQESTT